MQNYLSDRALAIKPSATVAANDKAKALAAEGIDIINLTAGQPDFPTPDFAKSAGIAAINENKQATPQLMASLRSNRPSSPNYSATTNSTTAPIKSSSAQVSNKAYLTSLKPFSAPATKQFAWRHIGCPIRQ